MDILILYIGEREAIFPVQLTTGRFGNLTRLIYTLSRRCYIHTYIHTQSCQKAEIRFYLGVFISCRFLWKEAFFSASPVSGTSVGLETLLICSMSMSSGDRPPWAQKILSSTIAAMGRQLKQSVNVLHSFAEYRRLPERF